MSLLLEFSMTPLDKGESVSAYVARSLDIIDRSGLPYKMGPMGTCVEGEWDQVMAVAKECYDRMREDCQRITISMRADHRAGKGERLDGKIKSVEKQLGRKMKA
ncbi:MAG: MTH1187 family thiamine-binding protein [Magnetococcales bacterium]|nr:MTH1187 family thiamine-binding protein [Magnetococcales bacterium]